MGIGSSSGSGEVTGEQYGLRLSSRATELGCEEVADCTEGMFLEAFARGLPFEVLRGWYRVTASMGLLNA